MSQGLRDVPLTRPWNSMFNKFKDRKLTGWEGQVTASQVLQIQESREEAGKESHVLDKPSTSQISKPERTARMRQRKISRNEFCSKQNQQFPWKEEIFQKLLHFFLISKFSALSVYYFSHWGKSVLKRNSPALTKKNKWKVSPFIFKMHIYL